MYDIPQKVKEVLATLQFLANFIITSLQKNPRTFKIGVSSIFIAVSFLVLLQSALQLTSILFLKLAEDQNGQTDLLLTPSLTTSSPLQDTGIDTLPVQLLNVTDVSYRLSDSSYIAAISPRWILPINVSTPSSMYTNYQAIGIILDSKHEREQGIGQRLEVSDLHYGQCWITTALASMIKLEENQVWIKVDLLSLLTSFGGSVDDMANQLANSFVTGDKALIPNFLRSLFGDIIDQFMEESRSAFPIDFDFLSLKPWLQTFFKSVLTETLNFSRLCNITEEIDNPEGKWPSSYENVAVIDSKSVIPMIVERFFNEVRTVGIQGQGLVMSMLVPVAIPNLNMQQRIQELEAKMKQAAWKADMNQFAFQGNVLFRDRPALYTSQNAVHQGLVEETDRIFERLGINYPVLMSSPLADALDSFFLFKLFLNNTAIAVIFLLVLLSILLIYSLMNQNVQDKNYELGMLRVLGLKKIEIMVLLLVQSSIFGLLGLLLGYALAYALNAIMSYFMFEYTLLKTSYIFGGDLTALIGLAVGLLVPFFSNIVPIQRVLSQTLRDSLNVYQRSKEALVVKIERLVKVGISPSQILAALIFIIIGFLALYVAPYAFIYSDMPLFFTVLNIVLILMICGISLLASLVQGIFQKLILKVILFFAYKYRSLKSVIKQNFKSHHDRNKKTSLLFTLTLAFLIFSGCGFRLNSTLIIDQLRLTFGSDLVITSLPTENTFLDEAQIRDQLERFKLSYPEAISDYAFVSQGFTLQDKDISVQISSLAFTPRASAEIISVDESYFQSISESVYVPDAYDPQVGLQKIAGSDLLDGSQALYNKEGLDSVGSYDPGHIITLQDTKRFSLKNKIVPREVRLIIPESLAKIISVQAGTSGLLKVDSIQARGRIRGIATKLPGFAFTGYTANSQNILITSHDDYKLIRDTLWADNEYEGPNFEDIQNYKASIPPSSSYEIPKVGLLVKLEKNNPEKVRKQLVNAIKPLIKGKYTLLIDVIGMTQTLSDALFFIDVFLIIVAIISLILSFFFTIVAFLGNVNENMWEFGVLRAVGLTKSQMSMIYILEALCVILAATILGTIAGSVVAVVVSAQFSLFTELPMKFMFPTAIFLVTVGVSIMIGILGSKYAVNQVKNKQIANIVKAAD